MTLLDINAEQLTDACRAVYEPGKYAHAPAQLFYDQQPACEPPTTFIRASFHEKFSSAAAVKLEKLRTVLAIRHGMEADVVFVCYFDTIDAEAIARHALEIQDR